MNKRFSSFAIVPAAGLSRRMGRHKLLLPWGGASVLEHAVAAWRHSRVDHVVLVVRKDDSELVNVARRLPVQLVLPPVDPPDMRSSVQQALGHIAEHHHPAPNDVWLLAPADIPDLSSAVIDRLLDHYQPKDPSLLVPRHAGRSGHPLLVPWRLAVDVPRLPAGQGVNGLLSRFSVRDVDCSDIPLASDIDTPEQYRRRQAEHRPHSADGPA